MRITVRFFASIREEVGIEREKLWRLREGDVVALLPPVSGG